MVGGLQIDFLMTDHDGSHPFTGLAFHLTYPKRMKEGLVDITALLADEALV